MGQSTETEEVYIANSDLELHPETVKQRQDTYSSLTDLAGIEIFYDSFREKAARIQQEQDERSEKRAQKVFVEEMLPKGDSDIQMISNLFTEQEEVVLSPDYQTGNKSAWVIETAMVLIAVSAMLIIYIFFFKNWKKRGKGI